MRAYAHAQVEAQEFISTCDCPDFLRKAERRLTEEADRVTNYLDPSTELKVTRVVEETLIGKQVGSLGHCRWGLWLEQC